MPPALVDRPKQGFTPPLSAWLRGPLRGWAEELRWLEYGQRLVTRHRNIAATAASPSVGETLLAGVQASAAQATGFAADVLAGDVVTLDPSVPALIAARATDLADRWIFGGNRVAVDTVTVAGRRVVEGGRHADREAVAARYAAALGRLLAD